MAWSEYYTTELFPKAAGFILVAKLRDLATPFLRGEAKLHGEGRDCLEPVRRRLHSEQLTKLIRRETGVFGDATHRHCVDRIVARDDEAGLAVRHDDVPALPGDASRWLMPGSFGIALDGDRFAREVRAFRCQLARGVFLRYFQPQRDGGYSPPLPHAWHPANGSRGAPDRKRRTLPPFERRQHGIAWAQLPAGTLRRPRIFLLGDEQIFTRGHELQPQFLRSLAQGRAGLVGVALAGGGQFAAVFKVFQRGLQYAQHRFPPAGLDLGSVEFIGNYPFDCPQYRPVTVRPSSAEGTPKTAYPKRSSFSFRSANGAFGSKTTQPIDTL